MEARAAAAPLFLYTNRVCNTSKVEEISCAVGESFVIRFGSGFEGGISNVEVKVGTTFTKHAGHFFALDESLWACHLWST